MLELMEMIVDILVEVADEMRDCVINIFYAFAGILLVLTIPLWIIPFSIWKNRRDV